MNASLPDIASVRQESDLGIRVSCTTEVSGLQIMCLKAYLIQWEYLNDQMYVLSFQNAVSPGNDLR